MLGDFRHGRGLLAQLLIALALIAAGLQSGIPRGYMLDRNAETGQLSVVFCTGQGPVSRWIDPDSGEITDHAPAGKNGNGGSSPCVFAMAAAAGPLPVAEAWVPPAPVHHNGRPRSETAHAVPAHRARPPARAPPATL